MARTRAFDAAEYLDSPEMIAEYLTAAFETDDAAFIARAIGTVARSQGMGAVAESARLSRENLHRALSGETKPEFETIRKARRTRCSTGGEAAGGMITHRRVLSPGRGAGKRASSRPAMTG